MDTMYDIRRILSNHQKRFERFPPDVHNRNSAILPATVLQGLYPSHQPPPRNSNAAVTIKRTPHAREHFLLQCLGEPAPAEFFVRVSVIGLNPIDHSKPCTVTRNLMRRFHFSFRLKDETAELDAMVSDKLAESLFGVSAANVLRFHSQQNTDSTFVDERAAILRATAEEKLQSILSSTPLLI